MVCNFIYDKNAKYCLKDTLPMCVNDCPLIDDSSSFFIYIDSHGNIFPCQLISDANFNVGNVKKIDFQEIENKISLIQSKVKERLNIDYGCRQCFLKNNCKKGCPAKALAENHDILANDNCCILRRKQVLSLLKMRNQL